MKIALGIEYDGAAFYGWQRQAQVPSIQQHLEQALSKVADSNVQIHCAGRTDAGVHATGQVVHFETEVNREDRAWTLGVNANLPDSIAVKWVAQVADGFHARFSATARRYRYLIYNHPLRTAILPKGLTHVFADLNATKMHNAARCLLGENDFSAFRAAHCQSNSPWRNVTHLNVSRHGQFVLIDIQANAFVHHMVRNIAGSLIEVGVGNQTEAWMEEILASKDRKLAAATAKPNGLYLVDVVYPERFKIPKNLLGPVFLECNI